MNSYQRDVALFDAAMGTTNPPAPLTPLRHVRALRARLIAEEVAETIAALGFMVDIHVRDPHARDGNAFITSEYKDANLSLTETADGIADSVWVLLGTALAYGIDLDPVWDEVARSNVAKARGPVRPDGKRLKPEGWTPPDIEGALGLRVKGCACIGGDCAGDEPVKLDDSLRRTYVGDPEWIGVERERPCVRCSHPFDLHPVDSEDAALLLCPEAS